MLSKISKKRLFAIVILFALSINVVQVSFGAILVSAQSANAVWVDKAHIRFNNSDYVNKNPYHGDPAIFTGEKHPDSGCENEIDVFNSNDSQGTFTDNKPDPSGKCANQKSTIQIDGTDGSVTFYKVTDSVVMAVVGITCKTASGDVVDNVPVELLGPTYYKKWGSDPGVPTGSGREDAYFRVKSDGLLARDDFIRDKGGGNGDINVDNCNTPLPQHISHGGVFKNAGEIVSTLPNYAPDPPKGVDLGTATRSDGSTPAAGADAGTTKQTCESHNGTIIIGWLICGVLTLLDDAANTATNVVDSLLDFKTELITSGNSASKLFNVWSLFRIISTVSLLAIALIMIIGQAMSGD